ncbi:hypothetical protein RBB78_09860 [Tunturiibacter empetritectus]|uniref:hypothetical protein n=1 Tax=Tunturiibacter empetritectus TaxID=3069691 RepID=UPI003D9B1D13
MKPRLAELTAIRAERFLLMAELAKLPKDMVFFTQITMEAGEDGEYLDAMRKANIKGALVGVEAVTPEGLKAVFKDFNYSGVALANQLQTFKKHGVHVLGSFIFGLPTDKPATFDATVEMALKAGVTFAQFVMMTPFPGTVDFNRWEIEQAKAPEVVATPTGDIPITRYWLIPTAIRPKMFTPHPTMSSLEISQRTQKVWDRFYDWSSIWERSACTPTLRARVAFMFLSKLYRQMYAGTGISTDSARRKIQNLGPLDRQAMPQTLRRQTHARTPIPSMGARLLLGKPPPPSLPRPPGESVTLHRHHKAVAGRWLASQRVDGVTTILSTIRHKS